MTCHRVGLPGADGSIADLVLSAPGRRPTVCASSSTAKAACEQPTSDDLRLIRQAVHGQPVRVLHPPQDPDARARYRWHVGHHAAFAVWQLQTQLLETIAGSAEPEPHIVTAAARLFDVYSLLLLYAGSCSAERYEATVRADMAAAHPAFSGSWSRDHELVLASLQRVMTTHPTALLAPLTRAVALNHDTHQAVASRLVPGGGSLLQEAGRYGTGPTEAERDLYDTFFHVRRGLICQRSFNAQVLRRLAQIACDIARFGLDDQPEWGFLLLDLAHALSDEGMAYHCRYDKGTFSFFVLGRLAGGLERGLFLRGLRGGRGRGLCRGLTPRSWR